ncbi:MAG: nucleotide sugar dehydrogenase [Gemmatimonadota bacterium]
MNVSVFGLGYVGSVTAACLAQEGHDVVGVDVNPLKVDPVNDGRSPILEKGLEEVVAEVVDASRLRATRDSRQAVLETGISLVCVGTPSRSNGSLDVSYVKRVAEEIGAALKVKDEAHTVVFRSTMLPGTTEGVLIPLLKAASDRSVGDGLFVGVNPEFLREGESIEDFYHPSRIVAGSDDEEAFAALRELYATISAPFVETSIRAAEMIKYIDNSFHALKVCFANEISEVCRTSGVDPHEAMRIFALDRQLNISPAYFRPGFAFGGSCLPKDLRAILHKSGRDDLDLPLLSSILPSNEKQVQKAIRAVLEIGNPSVGVLGLSFKPGTDDLRESPIIEVIETLLGKGCELRIYDPYVSLGRLHGSNKAFLEEQLPHVSSLMSDDLAELVRESEVIVIASRQEPFRQVFDLIDEGHVIVDLVGIDAPGLE